MNDVLDPLAFGIDEKFAIGQPVPRSEDPVLLRGEGHYSDDFSLPGPGLCGDGAQPLCAWRDPRHRHGGGARDAGRAGGLHRGRSGGRRHRPIAGAAGHEQPRRHADAASRRAMRCRPTRCGMSARRSPPSSPRRVAAAKDAAEAVARRYRSAAGGHRAARGRCAPGAPLRLRRRAGQCRARFPFRRQREGRRRLCRAPRMSRGCGCATTASSSTRWSRARRSPNTTPRGEHWTLHVGCQGVFGFRNYIAAGARRRARPGARR